MRLQLVSPLLFQGHWIGGRNGQQHKLLIIAKHGLNIGGLGGERATSKIQCQSPKQAAMAKIECKKLGGEI